MALYVARSAVYVYRGGGVVLVVQGSFIAGNVLQH